ncbi:MAG: 30S ribosomal protein S5 [Candidatus Saccharimonadales bacterium]
MDRRNENQSEFNERVINIDRVARVVKGGRRFRFRALVVIGDGKGKIGMGISKGADVTTAISKAALQAQKRMVKIPVVNGTIPHEAYAKHSGGKVLLKPAGPGTGVIAGGAVRDVLEVAGVTDILSKSLGSSNKINCTYATFAALEQLVKVKKVEA